ncbi:MAG: protein kinase [Cyanobacteria bacterium SBLK]|nr:protein kinase [Cyanobacteria bacterium SBLK]
MQRYQTLQTLGQHTDKSTVTFLALDTITQKKVIVKKISLNSSIDANNSSLDRYKERVKALQELKHSGIVHYLHTYKDVDFFYVVREHLELQSLAEIQTISADNLKKIILAVLDILIYLQKRVPPIIHHNLKPENILIDTRFNAHLVDFEIDDRIPQDMKEELGFISPEQRRKQKSSKSTDLYALGATILCILTHTKSKNITRLINQEMRFVFRDRLIHLNPDFLDWLERMVKLNPQERHLSAFKAKGILKQISVEKISEVRIKHPGLTIKSKIVQEKLTKTFRIRRFLPNSIQEGIWEVAPHTGDFAVSPREHPWIAIAPSHFHRSQSSYQVTIDTSHLLSGQLYERNLILHTFFPQEKKYIIPLRVKTARVEQEPQENAAFSRSLTTILLPSAKQTPKQSYNLTEEEIQLALTRDGTPTWTEEDFQNLMQTLGKAGYGWLTSEGVYHQLEKMKENFRSQSNLNQKST